MLVDSATLPENPKAGYEAIQAVATQCAGEPGDILKRVLTHHELYLDSGGNHAFPLVALHGALWGAEFFETTGAIGNALRARYFYDATERKFRMAMLNGFAEGFKTVNRQVFIDTFTNYHFTKFYGDEAGSTGLINPDLFSALNQMHEATRAGAQLPERQKRDLFEKALLYEQEVTVAPGVQLEVERFDCPILRFLCLRPVVHLAYFPRSTFMFFRNFSNKLERIDKAMLSFDIAQRTGWDRVEAAMRRTKLMKAQVTTTASDSIPA
jgi:hypothetical protein